MTNEKFSTDSNFERTFERDMVASGKVRWPSRYAAGCSALRSIDYDPTLLCDDCALPIMVIEWTREDGYKATDYTRALAGKLGVPAYLMRHSGSEATEVTDLRGRETFILRNKEEFKAWGEGEFRNHKQMFCLPPTAYLDKDWNAIED